MVLNLAWYALSEFEITTPYCREATVGNVLGSTDLLTDICNVFYIFDHILVSIIPPPCAKGL